MSFLELVNKTLVTPELLSQALQVHADMKPERRNDYEAWMFELHRFLDSKGLKKARRELAIAID